MREVRRPGASVVAAVIACSSCGLDIPPPSYINVTEIAAVRTLVELGPLHPDRVGPLIAYANEMPISEMLPGDRVRFEVVVVDTQGLPLPADEVETLWLQCGRGPCARYEGGFGSWLFDTPCAEVWDYSMDDYCLLGTGNASFEFEAPKLGPQILSDPRMSFYGAVAWGGQRVQDCWDARRGDKTELERCGFIYHNVTVGPPWWMLAYADSLGMITPFEVDLFPPGVFLQSANRIPRAPELSVIVDGEPLASGRPPLPTISVDPGANIEVSLRFDELSQLFQASFQPTSHSSFVVAPEQLLSRTATSGAIRRVGEELPVVGDGRFVYAVDPLAMPGRSRVLIGYRDDRGANDLLTLEFEVR